MPLFPHHFECVRKVIHAIKILNKNLFCCCCCYCYKKNIFSLRCYRINNRFNGISLALILSYFSPLLFIQQTKTFCRWNRTGNGLLKENTNEEKKSNKKKAVRFGKCNIIGSFYDPWSNNTGLFFVSKWLFCSATMFCFASTAPVNPDIRRHTMLETLLNIFQKMLNLFLFILMYGDEIDYSESTRHQNSSCL